MNCKENSATAGFIVGKVKSFPGPMDRYSILDQSSTISPAAAMPKAQPASAPQGHGDEAMRFPGEDGGKSLSETAREDLDAALQLLVERAKYITGAMAATISLYEDGELICHACTGTPKQKTGTRLQVGSGLATESVRTRRILRCNDTSVDVRTNSENCGKFGISSAMVMPLARGPEVIGVFELLSGMTQALRRETLARWRGWAKWWKQPWSTPIPPNKRRQIRSSKKIYRLQKSALFPSNSTLWQLKKMCRLQPEQRQKLPSRKRRH